jgi:hypothetical protein
MRAIFEGGPYHSDVGRCVPGPPPPPHLPVAANNGTCTYHLLSVLSWNDPSDPFALYVAGRFKFVQARIGRWLDGTGLPFRLRRLRQRIHR